MNVENHAVFPKIKTLFVRLIVFFKSKKLISTYSVLVFKNILPKCLKHIGKAASEQSFLNRFTGLASSVPSIRLVDIKTQLAPLPVKENRKERIEIQMKTHNSIQKHSSCFDHSEKRQLKCNCVVK